MTSLNFRLARTVAGAADAALPLLVKGGRLLSTLVFSPPDAGKTTFLRDLARQVSSGRGDLGLRPLRVAVLGERLELGGGNPPSFDLGPRTDLLAVCPPPAGLEILLRSLNPEVMVTDELGHPGDVAAVAECLRCGVVLVASAHAGPSSRPTWPGTRERGPSRPRSSWRARWSSSPWRCPSSPFSWTR